MSGEFSSPDDLLTAGDAGADLPAALATGLGAGATLFVLTASVLAVGADQLPTVAGLGLLLATAAVLAARELDGRPRDLLAGIALGAVGPAVALLVGVVRGGSAVDAGVIALGLLAVLGAAIPGVLGRSPLVGFAVTPGVPLGTLVAVALLGGVEGAGPAGAVLAAAGFVPVALAFGFVGVGLAVAVRYARERRQA